MNKIPFYIAFLFVFITLSSAAQETVTYDLDTLNIPVTVIAPGNASVGSGIGNGMVLAGARIIAYEITKNDFCLEVTMSDEPIWQEIDEYYAFVEELIQDEKGFRKFIVQEPHGFIYSYKNEGNTYYGMFYVIEKNDRFIEFSTGVYSNDASLENVKAIYAAAKTAR